MTLHWPAKGPLEVADYDLDWSQRLAVGDTITASVWTLPSGSTLVIASNSFTTTLTKVFLSGGLVNQTYTLTNTVTTALADTLIETVGIMIKDK